MRNRRRIGLTNLLVCCALASCAIGADLAGSKEIYARKLKEIKTVKGAKGEALLASYRQSLEALLVDVRASGDLDKTTAVMQEKERFQRAKKVSDEPPSLTELASLWSTYKRELRKAQLDSARATVVLRSQYDEALDRLQRSLVTAGDLEEARLVRQERERAASSEAHRSAKKALAGDSQEQTAKVSTVQPVIHDEPLTIDISQDKSWRLMNVAPQSVIWSDRTYRITDLPQDLVGSSLILRRNGEAKDSHTDTLKFSKSCNAYLVFLSNYNGQQKLTQWDASALQTAGWSLVMGSFSTTTGSGGREKWIWQVYKRQLSKGPFDPPLQDRPVVRLLFISE